MAATSAGTLKAYLEAQGLSLPWYRRRAPKDQARPFGTIQEAIVLTVERTGDQGDPAAQTLVAEQVQLDLWQDARTAAGTAAERYDLPGTLLRLLRSAQLVPVGSAQVFGVDALSMREVPDPDPTIIHHAITCTIRRAA